MADIFSKMSRFVQKSSKSWIYKNFADGAVTQQFGYRQWLGSE
jgi:hypothetical protein